MVFVTNADGSKKIEGITYAELKSDARKAARELKKTLAEVEVAADPPEVGTDTEETPSAELAEWTNVDGKTIKARVNAKEDTRVQFEMENGQLVWYPIMKLSAESQEKLTQE